MRSDCPFSYSATLFLTLFTIIVSKLALNRCKAQRCSQNMRREHLSQKRLLMSFIPLANMSLETGGDAYVWDFILLRLQASSFGTMHVRYFGGI